MSPGEFLHVLLRRWYVLVIALLLTAGGVYHVLRPTRLYLSTAVVVLKPPATGSQPNQLANLQPALATDSLAVLQQMQSPTGLAQLRAAGVHGSFTLAPRNSGTTATPAYLIPSVQLQSELPNPAAADAVVQRLVTSYIQHVQALQNTEGVPAAARMSVTVLVPPAPPRCTGRRAAAWSGWRCWARSAGCSARCGPTAGRCGGCAAGGRRRPARRPG